MIQFWLNIIQSEREAVRQRLVLVQYLAVDEIMLPQRLLLR